MYCSACSRDQSPSASWYLRSIQSKDPVVGGVVGNGAAVAVAVLRRNCFILYTVGGRVAYHGLGVFSREYRG